MSAMRFLVMCTKGSGGTWPPVIAVAKALAQKGHRVLLYSEQELCDLTQFEECVVVPQALTFTRFYNRWRESCRTDKAQISFPGFLDNWAAAVGFGMQQLIAEFRPNMLISCFSCIALADQMSQRYRLPWCLINPAFYFGQNARRSVHQDFDRYAAEAIEAYYPQRFLSADLVLHTTDKYFDLVPEAIPGNNKYCGFLYWEPERTIPNYLAEPGDPWVLYSPSTADGEDDHGLLQIIVRVLARKSLRLLVTHPNYHKYRSLAVDGVVYIEPPMPHSRVMPYCSYYLGPAGHGIVSKCLLFGLPMLLWSAGVDQPGVCFRARRLGVALELGLKDFSEAQLQVALDKLLAGYLLMSRAKQLAVLCKDANHSASLCAVEAIENVLEKKSERIERIS